LKLSRTILLVTLGAVLAPPDLDIGVSERLAVDRPRAAMIVRRRFRAALEAVRQHVEVQLRVAIEQLGSRRMVRAAMRGDEVLLLEKPCKAIARLFAAAVAWIGLHGILGVLTKLLERVAH